MTYSYDPKQDQDNYYTMSLKTWHRKSELVQYTWEWSESYKDWQKGITVTLLIDTMAAHAENLKEFTEKTRKLITDSINVTRCKIYA
jgi:hypothetical protein